jgi:MoxR-like ATPase
MALPKGTTEVWDLMEKVLASANRVLLYGPPGTGKTHISERAGLRTASQKVYSVTLTEETPASELRGHFVPKGNEFVWHDGPAVRAWREGARLIINEVDRASQDVWSFLLSVLDDPSVAKETLPTGENIKPRKGFHVIGTMNGDPKDLTEALSDRFAVRLAVLKPNPAAIQALSVDLRKAAMSTCAHNDEDQRIGLRRWFAFDELRAALGDEDAAAVVFGARSTSVLTSIQMAAKA